jgi:2-polyprenyl-6-methoxyphenol hydroxylase-like FAD-dependent oxidoreductase
MSIPTTHDSPYDVLVVGAGPAGLATALSAARHGARVLVVEKHAGTSIHPRASGISTRTIEIFRAWGLERAVRALAQPVSIRTGIGRTLTDPGLIGVPNGFPDPEEALAVSPSYPASSPQDVIEPLLVDEVRRLGGEVRFSTALHELDVAPDVVRARLVDRTTGIRRDVRARFVVGADGTRSMVRAALGVGVEYLGTAGDYAQVLFRADLDASVGDRRYSIYAIGHERAAGLLLPFGPGRWGFARQWFPERGEAFEDLTPDRWTTLLRLATGVADLHPEILDAMPFTLAAEVATAVRSGRAFLVGDAAHRMTPFGAAGLNTAVADGHNLGWKLAWAARGLAGEALLDSYAAERMPVGHRNTRQSLLPRGAGEDPMALDLGPRYRSAVIAGDGSAAPDLVPPSSAAADAGERAPHVWVTRRSRRVSTLDLFGSGFTLVVGREGTAWRRAAATRDAGEARPPLRVVVAGTDVDEPDGALTRAYRLGDTGAVLVRPDGYVAWRVGAEAGADELPPDPRDVLLRAVDRSVGHAGGATATAAGGVSRLERSALPLARDNRHAAEPVQTG